MNIRSLTAPNPFIARTACARHSSATTSRSAGWTFAQISRARRAPTFGSITQIDGPLPPNDTLADLLVIWAASAACALPTRPSAPSIEAHS